MRSLRSTRPGPKAGPRLVPTFPLALLAALCVCATLQAAEFGVDRGGPSPPPGYFMLVGDEAIQEVLTLALGDIPHNMTLYIEVTDDRDRLTIDLYDPGLYNPAGVGGGAQLDSSFSTTDYVGRMWFALIAPDLSMIAQQFYDADTAATNRQLDRFFNTNNVGAGTYQLYIELMDTAGTDEDVSVFGVSIPNHHVYSYNYCVGHNNQAGAVISDPILLYPFIDYGYAAMEGPFQVCGFDFVNYDMDSADHGVAPPSMTLSSPRGTFDNMAPATNMSFFANKVPQVFVGALDSDDQGIWRWETWDLGLVDDPVSPDIPDPYDLNAYSMQVYDYGMPSPFFQDWPYQPSFLLPLDDRHPRRIYLPMETGSWPEKESMGHRAAIVGGLDPITVGFPTTLEVTFTYDNPREYDITITGGATYVNPGAEFGDPVITDPGNNLTAAVNPGDAKQIDISGAVLSGTTESFTYTVEVTPTTPGLEFLTGDGSDFTGGAARQTIVTYTTPATLIYGDEQFGPICGIYFIAVEPVCVATADVVPSATEICEGESADLDATGSTMEFCDGGTIEYQWSTGGNVTHPYPGPDSITVSPTADTTYTLEVRCSIDDTCTDFIDQPIIVHPAPVPVVAPAAPDMCPGGSVTLTLTNPGDYQTYTWSTNPGNLPGDGVQDTPSVDAFDIGAVYTVTGETANGCSRQASVTITERTIPPPTITPANPEICPGQNVRLEVTGSYDRCEWATNPPGAPGDGSTDCWVDTDQPNVRYTVTVWDADGCSSQAGVDVTERTIPPPRIDPPVPGICPGQPTRISVVGNYAACEWATNPPGASGDGSPDCFVDADQPLVEYTVTVWDADGCSSQAAVTTEAVPDVVPPVMGNVLRVAKTGVTDILLTWTNLPGPIGEYWIPHLDADSDGDGVYDTPPTTPNLEAAPYDIAGAAPESYVEAGGQVGPSYLVFYKIRGVSQCYFTPGPL